MDFAQRRLPREFSDGEQDCYRAAAKALIVGLPLPIMILYSITLTTPAKLLDPLRHSLSNVLATVIFLLLCVGWPLSVAGFGVAQILQGAKIRAAKRTWAASATRAVLPVVDRSEEYNPEAMTREEMWVSRLAVRLPPQLASQAGAGVIWAHVDPAVYALYIDKDCIPVYYASTNPHEFAIDGEW